MPTLSIVGQVNDQGGVETGTGFSSSQKSTGDYEVDYSSAFSGEPIVLVTAVETDDSSPRIGTLYNTGIGGFQVSFVNTDKKHKNTGFNFAVMTADG